jgi:hypothetical protein
VVAAARRFRDELAAEAGDRLLLIRSLAPSVESDSACRLGRPRSTFSALRGMALHSHNPPQTVVLVVTRRYAYSRLSVYCPQEDEGLGQPSLSSNA